MLNSFRQEADVLRGDTDALMTMLMDKVEEVLVDVQPEIYADYKQLKHDIKEQRLERSLLLKTIEHLQRNTEEQRTKIKSCQVRLAVMEDQVGMIANTEAYKANFIPEEEPAATFVDSASITDKQNSNSGSQEMLQGKSSKAQIVVEDSRQ